MTKKFIALYINLAFCLIGSFAQNSIIIYTDNNRVTEINTSTIDSILFISNTSQTPTYGVHIIGTATDNKVYPIDQEQYVIPTTVWDVKEVQYGMTYGIYWLNKGEFSIKNRRKDGSISQIGAFSVKDITQSLEGEPEFTFQSAALNENIASPFEVMTSGLYYIISDTINWSFWLVPINNFDLFGGENIIATLDSASNSSKVSYSTTDVALKYASYKILINSAWQLDIKDIPFNGKSADDFRDVNCRPTISFGGSLTQLSPIAEDITINNEGKLIDISYTWNSNKKGIASISAEIVLGEDMPFTDYSNYTMGLIGNAIWDEEKGDWNSWEKSTLPSLPQKDSLIYTWSYNNIKVRAIENSNHNFLFRKDESWDYMVNSSIATITGTAKEDFNYSDVNFAINEDRTYNMSLSVNALDDAWTLTVDTIVQEGSHFYVIQMDDTTFSTIKDDVILDLRPDDVTKFMYNWSNTYEIGDKTGFNYYGQGDWMSLKVRDEGWSGGGYYVAEDFGEVDLSDISNNPDDYYFHIALKSSQSNTSYLFLFCRDVKICIGDADFIDAGETYLAYADFTRDGQWHNIEIPVTYLIEKGLFSEKQSFSDFNILALLSGGTEGTTLDIDAAFFYKK